jgi:phosphatidylserine decarboxylase
MAQSIQVWDRAAGRMAVEKVHGGGWMRFLYGPMVGRRLEALIFSRRFVSRLMGAWYGANFSTGMIPGFIRSQSIEMADFEPANYRSFNDFFVRKFQEGAREFPRDLMVLPAFAEARYLAFASVTPDMRFPVKGTSMASSPVLAVPEEAGIDPGRFRGGPLLIARLCPADYHRYHYPDSGRTALAWTVHGRYHSVNPTALAALGDVFVRNERRVSILETERFGCLAYVEVGALGVGRIVQTHDEADPFQRGEEKGMFLFGGSTVMVFGEPGAWTPSADLLEKTGEGVESLVRLGEPVGFRGQARNPGFGDTLASRKTSAD